jgi:hypothetical protein
MGLRTYFVWNPTGLSGRILWGTVMNIRVKWKTGELLICLPIFNYLGRDSLVFLGYLLSFKYIYNGYCLTKYEYHIPYFILISKVEVCLFYNYGNRNLQYIW